MHFSWKAFDVAMFLLGPPIGGTHFGNTFGVKLSLLKYEILGHNGM